jgi:hypothetical protein
MIASSSRRLVYALGLLVPMVSRADVPPPFPSDQQIEAARAQYREAMELHRQGKIKEAVERALDAFHTAATPVTALEAGLLLVEAGRLVQARDVVRTVALMPVSPRESDKGREARQEADNLTRQLDARIPKLAIAGRAPGVDVLLDGKPLASSGPNAWQGIDPGPHTVTARIDEQTCETIQVTVAEGEARTVELRECRPAPSPPLPPPPREPVQSSPPPPAPPAGSAHPYRWAAIAIGGAGLAAVAIGGAVALRAKNDYDSVAGDCPPRGCSSDAFDVRQSARARADAASVTMGIGGAAVAAGVLLWFIDPGAPSAMVGRPSVAIGAGHIALSVALP